MGIFVKDNCVKLAGGEWLCQDETGQLYLFTGKKVTINEVSDEAYGKLMKVKLNNTANVSAESDR